MTSRGFVLLLLAISGTLLLNSCTKKYTCQCSIKYSGMPGLPDSTVNEYEIINSKANAEKICKDASFEKEQNGIKVVETCKLY
jgi:hypothetical protein